MEYLQVVVVAVFFAGLAMMVLGSRRQNRDGEAARLAAVERKLDLIMKNLGIVEPQPDHSDVIPHLMQGQKIQAIKIYRERTGTGLAEAKDAVERIARDRGLDRR